MFHSVSSQEDVARSLRQRTDYDSIFSAIAINILTLAMPIAMMQVFDRVIPNESYGTLMGIFLALISVLIIDLVLKISRASYVLHAANQHGRAVRRRLSVALFDGDASALNKLGAEATIEKVMSLLGLRRTEREQLVKLVVDHIFSALFLLVIWALAGWLVVIPISVMGILLLVAIYSEPHFREAFRHRREYSIRRVSFLSEILNQAQLIKILGLEQPMLRRYEMLHTSTSVASRKIIQLNGLCYGAASVGSQIVTVLTCAFGGVMAIQGDLTIAELAACMLLTSRAVQPVIHLAFFTTAKDDANQRTNGLFDVVKAQARGSSTANITIKGGVTASNLSLGLPDSDGNRFRDVSFDAKPGELVVIDGPMASQPGNILKIIAGELAQDGGTIMLDGLELPVDQRSPPPGLIFEPREPVILDGSVLENVSAFIADADNSTGSIIADELGLSEQIARLPGGIRTKLFANNRDIGSPGFYKRISLCRALNGAPIVLLLEDPFAYLDPAGKRGLEAVLLELKGTATIVLTRPSQALLDAADHALVLVTDENGTSHPNTSEDRSDDDNFESPSF